MRRRQYFHDCDAERFESLLVGIEFPATGNWRQTWYRLACFAFRPNEESRTFSPLRGKMESLSPNARARCPLAAALSAALLVTILFIAGPAFAGPCENLSALKLPGATITSAESVAAGAFTPPGSTAAPPAV